MVNLIDEVTLGFFFFTFLKTMVPKVRMWKNQVKSLVFLRKRKILIKFLIKFVLKKAKNFCYFLLAAKKFLLAEQLGYPVRFALYTRREKKREREKEREKREERRASLLGR